MTDEAKRWRWIVVSGAFFAAAFAVGFGASLSACGSSNGAAETTLPAEGGTADATAAEGGGPDSCTSCVTDQDCSGGVCAQIGGDSFCAPACTADNGCALSGQSCIPIVTVAGAMQKGCVPANQCGGDDDDDDDSGSFEGGPTLDGGPVTGTVTADGGKVNRLFFSVLGDTRPATKDDVNGYPNGIITKLFDDIQALDPTPEFVVATGDYQFSTPTGVEAAPQLDLYLAARAAYKGPSFPALGNHECTGSTISNCGTGNTNGVTVTYSSFLKKLLKPIGQTQPYYEIDVDSQDGTWTSKFLFVAANAWDTAQGTWLEKAMERSTTYTFILRHEPAATDPAPPGVPASEAIMAKHPYTLAIVGHVHTYRHKANTREVLVGNGGAPLSSKGYGFALIQQRSDGAIVVDMLDWTTKLADPTFHFVVNPAGTTVP